MGICSISLAIGFHTPISKILLLLFTLTLHNSNPLIINALLWACLLAVGRVWSADRLLRPAEAAAAKPLPEQH
jgi:hypothetical protein